jgi:hypothetical protein
VSVNHNFTPGSSAYRPEGEFSVAHTGAGKITARPTITASPHHRPQALCMFRSIKKQPRKGTMAWRRPEATPNYRAAGEAMIFR